MGSDSNENNPLLDAIITAKENIETRFADSQDTINDLIGRRNGPYLDKTFFIDKLSELETLLTTRTDVSLAEEEKCQIFAQRLNIWTKHDAQYIFNESYTYNVTSSFIFLCDSIYDFLESLDTESPKLLQRQLSQLRAEILSLERSKEPIEKKIGDVQKSLQTIVDARDAALELPETLDSLRKANSEIQKLKDQSIKNEKDNSNILEHIKETNTFITETQDKIKSLIGKCEETLRASTGVGLASAFAKHAQTLRESSRWWVGALICALVSTVGLGYYRITAIFEMLKTPGIDSTLVFLNMIMSLMVLAAPVWLAWIAAKRILICSV